jgi:hypothetical protein
MVRISSSSSPVMVPSAAATAKRQWSRPTLCSAVVDSRKSRVAAWLWVGPRSFWVARATSMTMAACEADNPPCVATSRSISATSAGSVTMSTWATRARRKAKSARWRASAGSMESSCWEIRCTTSASGSRSRGGVRPSQSRKDIGVA